jgi:hypothetical protein
VSTLTRKLNLQDLETFSSFKAESQKPDFELNYILVHELSDQKPKVSEFDVNTGIKQLFKSKEKILQIIDNLALIHDSDGSNYITKLEELEPETKQPKTCCYIGRARRVCTCDYSIYKMRPYTFDILRAIQPFFEIIAISNIPHFQLE